MQQFMRSNALSPMVMVCTDRSSRGMDFDRAEVGHNEKPGRAAEQRNVSHDEAVRVQQSAVGAINLPHNKCQQYYGTFDC